MNEDSLFIKTGKRHICQKCDKSWFILRGNYNQNPSGRKPGCCNCGEPFPKKKKRK